MSASLDLQCVVQTAELGESPAGSAGSADRYVLVELPLPWPAKIDQHPALANVRPGPEAAGTTRILGVSAIGRVDSTVEHTGENTDASTAERPSGSMRVICYARTPGAPFVEFQRLDTTVTPDKLGALLTAINNCHLDRLTPESDNTIDVLICTHGSRDRCCGQHGTTLFLELLEQSLNGDLSPDVRLWRTSHTGGHRFAPTGMTFPDGLTWAGLDAERVAGIVSRELPVDIAATLNRGTGGIDSRPAQIADCRGFARYGWDWVSAERSTNVSLDPANGDTAVVVTIDSPLGRGRFTMHKGEPLPVPVCGEPLENSMKTTTQMVVTSETWA